MVAICSVVEGVLDQAVVNKLIIKAGGSSGPTFVKRGKQDIRKRMNGYVQASMYNPYLVVVDLDNDVCAPGLIASWAPQTHQYLCFRVAERSVESWLLADRCGFSKHFLIPEDAIPILPDELLFPKTRLIQLIKEHSPKDIGKLMVPRVGSGRQVGPAYNSMMIEFVNQTWKPEEARNISPSLDSCIRRLDELVLKIQ